MEKESGWSDDSLLRVSATSQPNLYNNINPSPLHHTLVGRSTPYSLSSNLSNSTGLTSSMSSPSLQSLGQSRSSSQLYGGSNGNSNMSTSLSSSRLNSFSTGLGQSSTNSSLGLSSANRGLNQPSGLTNGFPSHQTNPSSNLNSKFSPGLGGNSLSSNFGSNSFGSNFGNNIMNILGSGSTSPSSVGSFGATSNTQGTSHIFGSQQPSQGSSHLFGSGLSNNSGPYSSQFNNIPNNNSYSSFNTGVFSPSLDLNNTTSESLDLSEFPSLQAPAKQLSNLRLDTANGLPGMGSHKVSGFNLNAANGPFSANITGNKTYSEVSNTNLTGQAKQDHSPGFQISHEDFPALPGAPKNPHPLPTQQVLPNDIMAQVAPNPQQEIKQSSIVMMVNKPSKSIVLPTFPPSMCKDQFGMAGLLAFIRSKDSCPNLIKFALGMDLCDLGLNLQSKGKLHSTFQSPWADRPCGLHQLEQNVPPDYRRLHVRLNINMIDRIKKYGDDLLFWLYYNNIGTTIQLLAIQELQNRGWMYYIPEKIWITKALGKEAPKGSYGVYCWFDVANWKKSEKEMSLEPDKIEFCEQSKPHFRL